MRVKKLPTAAVRDRRIFLLLFFTFYDFLSVKNIFRIPPYLQKNLKVLRKLGKSISPTHLHTPPCFQKSSKLVKSSSKIGFAKTPEIFNAGVSAFIGAKPITPARKSS
jgi:hypothetical protein